MADGFTAVRFTPFPRGYTGMRYADLIEAILQRVAAVRETVGNGVDLCVEIHRRMDPHHAAGLAQELARFRPYFLEDPILPDSIQAMCALQREIPVPIATGERLHTIWEFNELLAGGGCRFIRPDVCLCGGLTHSKKIAALAEAYHVGVIPHNPLSPVSTAACVQLDACIPNFALQEYTGEDRPAQERDPEGAPGARGGLPARPGSARNRGGAGPGGGPALPAAGEGDAHPPARGRLRRRRLIPALRGQRRSEGAPRRPLWAGSR